MRYVSTEPEPDEDTRADWWIVAVVTLIAVAAIGWAVVGCYPKQPVNPPSCAEDPTSAWCVPPAFAAAPDGGARGCRSVRFRTGKVMASCDDDEPAGPGVDLVIDARGTTWSACAWNGCGLNPGCRAKVMRQDGGAR
jgi:hypothetical protein